MYLGVSSSLEHKGPEDWAQKHVSLGLKCVNFPVDYLAGEETYMAYKEAADKAGLLIAEVGIWKNTLAADKAEREKWMDYAVGQLKMADKIGALCAVNVAGTPHGPRWDGGYRNNFTRETWNDIVAMAQEIIDRAKPERAAFSLESMPWMYPTGPDEYVQLIRDINRPQFKAHLDIVNMITTPERYFYNDRFLEECFNKLHGQILSCHLKDTKLLEGYTWQLKECACGEGTLDIKLFADLATRENANMPMIIEHLTTDEEYLASIKYVRNLLGI